MQRLATPHPRSRGITLTEAMLAMAVCLVAVGAAAPGFEAARERRHLEGVAAQLETDLQLARSEAVALNRTLHVGFRSDAAGACYVVHTGAPKECDCSGATPACTGGALALRSVRIDAASGVTLAANVRSMTFDPLQATVTPTSTMRVLARDGREIRKIVNIMGRVRTCSPQGGIAGVPAC